MTDHAAELTCDSDRLIREWRERFTGRRTIAHQMLEEAEVLVRDAVRLELEQQRRAETQQQAWDLERRERKVELAEIRHEAEKDRLRRQLAETKEKLDRLSPRATLMREKRETVDDGTVVRIQAPTVPSYGDTNRPRPWQLAELEEVAARLRVADARDDTEVRFSRDAIEVCVPYPEYALAPAPGSVTTPKIAAPERASGTTWGTATLLLLGALAMAVVAVLGVILL